MDIETDTRDRVIALEVKVQSMAKTVEAMDEKLTELHELLVAARGARWAIIGVATVGGFLAAKLFTSLPWLTSLSGK